MPEPDAFEIALGALRRKERTAGELRTWLERRGYGNDEVEAVVMRLVEAGVLDDERFARRYAEDKRELSGWGSERIREALLARQVLTRRGRPLGDNADRQRALEYLARRGYDYEIAYQAVRSASARAA